MPHMDANGMNHDGDADYSDFKYQHVQLFQGEGGGSSAVNVANSVIEPLGRSGGLEVNEVAELVMVRYHASVAGDNFDNVADTAQGSLEFKGVLGANLDSVYDQLAPAGDSTGNEYDAASGVDDSAFLVTADNSDPEFRAQGHEKDEVFLHFQALNDTPFSSDAGGVGGGGGFRATDDTIRFRDEVSRGPILDSNDDLAVVSQLIKNQVSANAEAILRMTLVWDIAEVDDAGRRFSVPSDD